MASIRLNKVIKELNIGLSTAVEKLAEKGHDIDNKPTTKISDEQYHILLEAFDEDRLRKEKAEQVNRQVREEKESHRTSKEASRTKEEVAAPEETPAPEPAPAKEVEKPVAPPAPKAEEPVAEKPKEEPKVEVKEKAAVAEKKPEPAPEPKKEEAKKEEEAPKKEEPKAEAKEAQAEDKKEAPKSAENEEDSPRTRAAKLSGPKVLSKIDLTPKKAVKKEEPKKEEPAKPAAKKEEEKTKEAEKPVAEKATEPKAAEQTEPNKEEPVDQNHKTKYIKLEGPKFTGQKIELPAEKPKKKPVDKKAAAADNKRKRKRIKKVPDKPNAGGGAQKPGAPQRKGAPRKKVEKVELTDEQIQKQIKETLEKLTTRKKSKGSKFRRDKRQERREQEELQDMQREEQSKVLKVTEFVTVTELANMMSASVNDVISTLMGLGVMVTMNQRLDAEVLSIVAEEFGYTAEFVDSEVTESFTIEEDEEKDLSTRAPIVTVMGHVDHGKTSLLDYIRSTNVIAGEAGGITQHIGAYAVTLESGQHLTFLDTPGHEAFTAMRARGAQVTDVAIIVIAADDAVMPQTKEAISHAQAANVPFVIALNKSDRPAANPDKIKEQLSAMNVLVEDWGGTVQCQQVSAKTGDGIPELLEKVLLESEMLDLKANPNRNSLGTVIEASLDKGRGYVTTILVENGTLKMGDYVLAGPYSGKVKAMLDERGHRMKEAGPSTPVSLLGLDGAPQAGDRFMVMDDEREAKQLAAKRTQLQREQSVRSQKKMTLEEIGRRLAIGDFQELNIVLKGDVDGSIEALADSLQKLSTPEIAVKIIHKGVGQISESDVLLASASDAILIGFQVRPSASARKIADREEVDIRLYSIIYDAINQIKDAMEGMLSPDVKEEITGTAEIRETFKISKVGTIAGCMVTDGTIYRNSQMRLIRDGVVIYTGELGSLKRFKDDVKEVKKGYECGLNVKNYNDIKVGDVVESFKEVEVKKTLD